MTFHLLRSLATTLTTSFTSFSNILGWKTTSLRHWVHWLHHNQAERAAIREVVWSMYSKSSPVSTFTCSIQPP